MQSFWQHCVLADDVKNIDTDKIETSGDETLQTAQEADVVPNEISRTSAAPEEKAVDEKASGEETTEEIETIEGIEETETTESVDATAVTEETFYN